MSWVFSGWGPKIVYCIVRFLYSETVLPPHSFCFSWYWLFFFFLRVQTSCIVKLELSDCFLVASFRFNFFGKNTIEVVVYPQGITSGGPKLFVLLLVIWSLIIWLMWWLPDFFILRYLFYPLQLIGDLWGDKFEYMWISCCLTTFHNSFSIHW